MRPTVIGAYGAWAAGLLGRRPGAWSLRTGAFRGLDAWRCGARARVWELLAPPPLPAPRPRVDASFFYDGLRIERLSWQLPWGPRTEAVFLRPADAGRAKLPGLLGLHDHGGRKYFGWRKIAQVDARIHPLIAEHRRECYGGLAWANEAARRGFAVLVHDTFPFASRRVQVADCVPAVRRGARDPGSREKSDAIVTYNRWASEHESQMAKSLFCAGTTWPGMYVREDQAALSILCARPDVDAKRVACGGLSGGGMRTVYLAGLDDRIRSCFCAGFFTTWRDFLLNKSHRHTWMAYVPLLARDLDFPEVLGLRAPLPTLVQNCVADPLYTLSEVKVAGRILAEVYRRAKAPKAFRLSLYPGGHVLDAPMQREAFEWLERWLG